MDNDHIMTAVYLPSPPVASFTANPTNGMEPVAVTFTDTSTGNITNRFWDFGDSNSTNVLTNSVSHTYTAGTYTVTLVVTGLGGVDTNTQPNYLSVLPAATIAVIAGDLQDRFGNLMPTSGVAALVVDLGTNGFVDPQSTFPLNLGAVWGADDRVVGLWELADSFNNFWGQPGGLFDQTVVVYTNGIAQGQKLQLYWFPSLTLASNTVGVTYYGKYTDTNSPPLNSSAPWSLPAVGSTVELDFYTQTEGGSNPDATGRATNLTVSLLTAFQNWQIQHFGSTNNPMAAPDADPDGDGQNNEAEFMTGTDPTNSASAFRITSVVRTSNDMRVTWSTVGGRTNAVQAAASSGGSYSNVSPDLIMFGSGDTTTNYLDIGAGTNTPSRFYRVRLIQ